MERTDFAIERLTTDDDEFRALFPSWNLAELTPHEIGAYLEVKDTVIVPMASTEQHGMHLPLCTDTVTATTVAEQVAESIGVLHTPTVWTGFSPQHMFGPGEARGTVTLRSSTLMNLLCDIGRSLIHHGFNRILFINGHGSNQKVIDPVLRSLKYETGAVVGFLSPIMERHIGLLEGLFEDTVDRTPGSHASDLETSQMLYARPHLVHLDRANQHELHIPDFLPDAFAKRDGRPDVEFEGHTYFTFPMEYREMSTNGATGAVIEASAEIGEEAFRRFSTYVAKGLLELQKVPVEVHNREFQERAL